MNGREAKEIADAARAKAAKTKKKATKDPSLFQLSEEQKKHHMKFFQDGIQKAAEKGLYQWTADYSGKDDKGEYLFPLEFFRAVARTFQEEYNYFQVLVDGGPQRRITVKWTQKHEV